MGFSPSHPRHPRPLPRGPRMSARVTLPLAAHRPPVCCCACAVTGPSRMSRPRHRPAVWPRGRLARMTALCRRSTRVSKGNDFSGKKRGINYFIRWKNFSGVRGSSEWSVSTSGYTNQYGTCRCATDCRAGTVWSGLPGQRRRALPAEVLRLSAPGWSAVCLAHCSSSESSASFARRGAASVLAGEIGSGLEGALEGRL